VVEHMTEGGKEKTEEGLPQVQLDEDISVIF